MVDVRAGTHRVLEVDTFRRNNLAELADSEQVFIKARDGMTLPAILTRPKGVSSPLPTILYIHGGPAGHEVWAYDHGYQFLANRGYAVLAVNFRGSTGLGKGFQAAGFGQYGLKMQDDIVDAANWAIEQGVADPDAMAVMGGSYGGYAAAMAVVRDPDVFKAAIVEHAVLDVEYQMKNNPAIWGLHRHKAIRYFGDPDKLSDLKEMRSRSPLNLVSQLKVPVLLVTGKMDHVVGFEQTEEFYDRAKSLGKEVEMLIFENEAHGVSNRHSQLRRAWAIEGFLAKHLQGRSGVIDYREKLAEKPNSKLADWYFVSNR